MAYKIKLGTFSKLENSTAQPTVLTWAEYDVNLKEGADYSNPVLTMNIAYSTVKDYNYAYFWDRYYWVTDKKMLRTDLVQLTLKVDVLATYKSTIGAASLYVLRSASSADGGIRDNFYPMDGGIQRYRYTCDSGVANPFSSGVYVVNIMGMQTGTSTLYQFTPADFTTLVNKLMLIADGFDLTDIIDQIKNAVFKPMNYINSVMWFPEAFTGTAYSDATLYIGYWSVEHMNYTQITDPVKHMNSGAAYTPVLGKHPQASTRGSYLNYAPYTEYSLAFPPFGVIPIDTTMVRDATYISVDLYVDALTGLGILRGSTAEFSDNNVLFEVAAQYGVQLPLLANGNSGSLAGSIATIGGMAAAMFGGGAVTAASLIAGASEAGIGNFEDAIIGNTSTIGSNGSIVAHTIPKYLDCRFLTIVSGDNTHNGRPLCQLKTISTLTGFVRVADGDVSISGPLPEQQEVKRFLEAGFFYE